MPRSGWNGTAVRGALQTVSTLIERLLDDVSTGQLIEAAGMATASYRQYGEGKLAAWGYEISRDRPLWFRMHEVDGIPLQVDLSCDVRWSGGSAVPCQQNILLRVWSCTGSIAYRNALDAKALRKKLNIDRKSVHRRRVMARYNFDIADAVQLDNAHNDSLDRPMSPWSHVQTGGNPADNELCWLPKSISVPRLAHPPLDLVLATEIVAANFLGDIGREVMKEPGWQSTIANAQRYVQAGYYEKCRKTLLAGRSILAESARAGSSQS